MQEYKFEYQGTQVILKHEKEILHAQEFRDQFEDNFRKFWSQLQRVLKCSIEFEFKDAQILVNKIGKFTYRHRPLQINLTLCLINRRILPEEICLKGDHTLATTDDLCFTHTKLTIPGGNFNDFWKRSDSTYKQYLRFLGEVDKAIEMRSLFTIYSKLFYQSELGRDTFEFPVLYWLSQSGIWELVDSEHKQEQLLNENYELGLTRMLLRAYQVEFKDWIGSGKTYMRLSKGNYSREYEIGEFTYFPLAIDFIENIPESAVFSEDQKVDPRHLQAGLINLQKARILFLGYPQLKSEIQDLDRLITNIEKELKK